VIDRNKITYYRHLFQKFDFTELSGKEKWTAYKFTKKVYDIDDDSPQKNLSF